MPYQHLSRRDFLRLAGLSLFGLAARSATRGWLTLPAPCAPPPSNHNGLSREQQMRLLEASRLFLAPDEESARQVALNVDFIEGPNEDASTMCGPLAVSILQTAGLLGVWASRHEFWLMNPVKNPRPIKNTFPLEEYYWFQFDDPVSKFDFNAFPLLAGDLVYLHARPGDNFEHALVVNRVDETGPAYSVTNFYTGSGTIIEERMLYDPQEAGKGQFSAWADRSIRNKLGNTGGGGFRIWRVKDARHLEFPKDRSSRKLREELDELIFASPGKWFGAIKQLGGPILYQFNPYEPFHLASTIKVPIAITFYHWLQDQAPENAEAYLEEHGVQGRSYAQLLRAMIVASEEEATEILVDFLGKNYLEDIWKKWRLKATQVDPRRSTATEILYLLEKLYQGRWLSKESRTDLLGLMATYTPNDATRLGLIRRRLPRGSVIHNKRASLVEWPRVVGDSGIIQLPAGSASDGPVYLFSLHGLGNDAASYEQLEESMAKAASLFGDFLAAAA